MSDNSDEVTFSADTCVICKKICVGNSNSTEWITVKTAKGLATLLQFSKSFGDDALTEYLEKSPEVVNVHVDCRKSYTNKRRYEQICSRECVASGSGDIEPPRKNLRSTTGGFQWKEDCFLCGCPATADPRHRMRSLICSVKTLELRQNCITMAMKRSDIWGLQVQCRLEACNDLVAEEAIYHRKCITAFFNDKGNPIDNVCKDKSDYKGKEDEIKVKNFNKLCQWLEITEDQLYSICELYEIMRDMAGSESHVYTQRHFRDKLIEKYGECLVLGQVAGKKDVVCFTNMASRIINDSWYKDRQKNIDDESKRIVIAAAKLIRSEIREMQYSTSSYPSCSTLNDSANARTWIPSLVDLLMDNIVVDDLKRTAISHAIVQAARPRSAISPVLFGVGVSFDHVYGSKWALDVLSRLGFSLSYDEIHRYKQCALQSESADMPKPFPNFFTQWSADNVDHNVKTLDGSGTFHGMGILAMSSACFPLAEGSFSRKEVVVERKERVTVDMVVRGRGIELLTYTAPEKTALSALVLRPIAELPIPFVQQPHIKFDMLWHAGWFYSSDDEPRPNWSGFMQEAIVSTDVFYSPSADIRMLPIIDLDPKDMNCIFSTLRFIEEQAAQLNMQTACVTFDQQLWIKAVEVVKSQNLNVVPRLGGFHTIMSYLGSLGKVMEGSGLAEAVGTCYGNVTVGHILSGKAESRAVRAHFLVQSVLYILLLQDFMSTQPTDANSFEGCQQTVTPTDELQWLFKSVLCSDSDLDVERLITCLEKLITVVEDHKMELVQKSRTAKYWLQYVEYVQVLQDFIRSERTCQWDLHLVSLSKMLNLFAATGHHNYAKSGRLYLQQMLDLPQTHPWLNEQLSKNSMHAVRRSDRYWAGLSTDLVIEQVMMKSIKSSGGLTHGRGMSESVRLMWVKTMHCCASVTAAVSELTRHDHTSASAHHVEFGKARRKRDWLDLKKVLSFFETNSPFAMNDCKLRSLATGVTASETDNITCDCAEDVGKAIMLTFDNKSYDSLVLKKSSTVTTLADLRAKVVGATSKKLALESSILFTRLITVAQRDNNIEPYFTFELNTVPPSLFSDAFTMRKTDKSILSKELTKCAATVDKPEGCVYVIDGGWLLHKVKWQQGGIYSQVVQQYVAYIRCHFGESVTVVFDGYMNGPNTKDHEHTRRAVKASPDICYDDNKPTYKNQSAFLGNESNKKVFVDRLCMKFIDEGIGVLQAVHDADTLVVSTALEIADSGQPVVVVANDTDIIVMLLYHFKSAMADIVFQSETKQNQHQTVRRSIRQIQHSLGSVATSHLLVAHAISGCDTVSALFGRGKKSVWNNIKSDFTLSPFIETISSYEAHQEDIVRAGMKILVKLYGGKQSDKSLNHLRYTNYLDMISTSTIPPRPERLPPTESAARYHIYRTHLQVVEWKTLQALPKNPAEWGWKVVEDHFVPVTTDQEAAPPELLKVIRCKCSLLGKRQPCQTHLCTCFRHGLPCVAACKHCCGEQCSNISSSLIDVHVCSEDAEEEETVAQYLVPEECLMIDVPWMDEEIVF